MRTRPRILLDIDGCFANFIDNALKVIHDVTGRHANAKHDDCNTYAMEIAFGLTAQERDDWFACIREAGYCSRIETYPGSRACVAALQTLGDVHPVTFPFPGAPWWIIEREKWLMEHLGIDPGLAVYTSQKQLIAGDFLVEDTTKHLINWRKHNPDGIGIRIARPYNASEPFEAGYTVDSFGALIEIVSAACELRGSRA